MVWIGGRSLAWWSAATIWIVALGNILALAHLRANGLGDLPWRDRLRYWTFRLRLLFGLVWIIGLARALTGQGSGTGSLTGAHLVGMVVGLTVAIGLMALADRRTRRRPWGASTLAPDPVWRIGGVEAPPMPHQPRRLMAPHTGASPPRTPAPDPRRPGPSHARQELARPERVTAHLGPHAVISPRHPLWRKAPHRSSASSQGSRSTSTQPARTVIRPCRNERRSRSRSRSTPEPS